VERAIVAAHERGAAPGQIFDLYAALGSGAIWGSMPVDGAIEQWETISSEASGSLDGLAHGVLGTMYAMQGDRDRAWEEIERAEQLLAEFGMTMWVMSAHPVALVGLLTGEHEKVVTRMRQSVKALGEVGETGFLSTSASYLAEALYRLGRHGEAEEAARLSEANAAEDDVSTQIAWRLTLSKILAASGRTAEAEPVAREAVAIADRTDHVDERGDSRLALATVLRSAGRTGEAAEEARRALAEYEAKGNRVGASWARDLLREFGEDLRPYNRGAHNSP
jgi:tetratricopeptide (TPR) repeat protein